MTDLEMELYNVIHSVEFMTTLETRKLIERLLEFRREKPEDFKVVEVFCCWQMLRGDSEFAYSEDVEESKKIYESSKLFR